MIAITRNKRFNVDRYLDEHGQIRSVETDKVISVPKLRRWYLRICDWQRRFELACDRIDNRLDRWLDRTDWVRIDIVLGSIGGYLLTSVILFLIYKLVIAVVSGAFARAVR